MNEASTREQLQDIRDKAEDAANTVKNIHWQRAYRDLADAADKLDAMEARTEGKNEPKEIKSD